MEHEIILKNLHDKKNTATYIRISPHSSNTEIENTKVSRNWRQKKDEIGNIIWSYKEKTKFNWRQRIFSRNKSNQITPIPTGDPIQGKFVISVKDKPGLQYVLIDWLDQNMKILCSQILNLTVEKNESDEEKESEHTSSTCECQCIAAETENDEGSIEFADPDLSVELLPLIKSGFRKITIPYIVESEPVNLQFTRTWGNIQNRSTW